MTSFMTDQEWGILRGMHGLRTSLLASLTDADLVFGLPGNPTLGELFRENGEIEQSYSDSFKNFAQEFSYGQSDPAVASDLVKLKAWFQSLDAGMEAVLSADFEADRPIQRGNFSLSPAKQLDIYTQAILIFYGKITVYFQALPKPLPEHWKEWIG